MSEMLMMQLEVTSQIFKANTENLSHEESLDQPSVAGNCLNWIGGHLVTAYNDILPALGEYRHPSWFSRNRWLDECRPSELGSRP
jgi:hypothetical protein